VCVKERERCKKSVFKDLVAKRVKVGQRISALEFALEELNEES